MWTIKKSNHSLLRSSDAEFPKINRLKRIHRNRLVIIVISHHVRCSVEITISYFAMCKEYGARTTQIDGYETETRFSN